MRAESRECKGLRKIEDESDKAARIRARFVTDLDPGIVRVEEIGELPRKGARHKFVIK
jgi:hypothetical protein